MEKERYLMCLRCGHQWKQRRKNKPKICPSCKSPNWNKINAKEFANLILG